MGKWFLVANADIWNHQIQHAPTPKGSRPYFDSSAPHIHSATIHSVKQIKQNQCYLPIEKKQSNLSARSPAFPLLEFSLVLESWYDIYMGPSSCLILHQTQHDKSPTVNCCCVLFMALHLMWWDPIRATTNMLQKQSNDKEHHRYSFLYLVFHRETVRMPGELADKVSISFSSLFTFDLISLREISCHCEIVPTVNNCVASRSGQTLCKAKNWLKLSVVSHSYGFENCIMSGQPKVNFVRFMIYLFTCFQF